MADLRMMLTAATGELSCPVCRNSRRGITVRGYQDECPECHGNHRHVATIALLEALIERVEQAEAERHG